MAGIWPFAKKSARGESEIKKKKVKIVEYERKKETSQKDIIDDKSHLKNKSFLDAMALLGDGD
ncbi:MAG TPA: hypothetical protein QF508_05285 [Candidatus Thalassarchaeaceae archaeon]|jgi:hypothetical protein|nr:hypothetical protein [Candidatus Thalassarchaeaceae archaeon]MDP7659356.1 hypothetical protein [Candidatus Thalassarchaeaceae archaeon]HJO42801.1 hypothetical protein [Candidatus Thalassarchaeaceae archaeon]